MTQEDIIEMAKEVGFFNNGCVEALLMAEWLRRENI